MTPSARTVTLLLVALFAAAAAGDDVTLNQKDDGYRGIWYFNQKSGDEYVYKYSGGLGTYCAKHQPFAVYCKAVDKTFFCYGGSKKGDSRALVHMVSYFDHKTGLVPRPTLLLDKQTDDAHDNPVIAVDDRGFVWIFSTSHGRSRPSYIHRSVKPYDIDAFARVAATYTRDDGTEAPLTNFSYMQAWHLPPPPEGADANAGRFVCFFTRYNDPALRTNMFMTSPDGLRWSKWQRLAAIEWGHYQISVADGRKAAAAFNYHPTGKGLNWRTNLYYIETLDAGRSWRSVDGQPLSLPLTEPDNAALVHDYKAEGLNVYLKDIRLDGQGRPVILHLTSRGYESGPKNAPRTWTVAHWLGARWAIHPVTTSDNNYDTGSLYLEEGGSWRVIGPTEPGPQPFNPGGEMALWVSGDEGATWKKAKQLTVASPMNHTYARRPVNAHPDFYALWADGHGRQPSDSRLFFCDRAGHVSMLPPQMAGQTAKPQRR